MDKDNKNTTQDGYLKGLQKHSKTSEDAVFNDGRETDEYTYLLPTEKNAVVVARKVYSFGSIYFALTDANSYSHYEIFISKIKNKMTPFVRLNGRVSQWEDDDEMFVCVSDLTTGHIFKKGAEQNDPHPEYVKKKLGGNLQPEVCEFIGKILGSYYRMITKTDDL